jgi:hypothetical protein
MRPVRTSEDAPAYPAVVRAILADLRRLVETESPSSDLDAVEHSAHVVAELVYERLGRRPRTVCVTTIFEVFVHWAEESVRPSCERPMRAPDRSDIKGNRARAHGRRVGNIDNLLM